jgi:RecA-family ATPase
METLFDKITAANQEANDWNIFCRLDRKRKPWLWQDRIPFGKLTLFAGHPGVGKGLATLDIAARASTGKGWADCKNTNPPVEVLIVSDKHAAGSIVARLVKTPALKRGA